MSMESNRLNLRTAWMQCEAQRIHLQTNRAAVENQKTTELTANIAEFTVTVGFATKPVHHKR